MAGAVISVEILDPGPRAGELLVAMSEALSVKARRKQGGTALLWLGTLSPQAAWEAAVDAANAAGGDWPDHLQLGLPADLNDKPRRSRRLHLRRVRRPLRRGSRSRTGPAHPGAW